MLKRKTGDSSHCKWYRVALTAAAPSRKRAVQSLSSNMHTERPLVGYSKGDFVI